MLVLLLISCRLDYYKSLLYSVPMHETDRLQKLQNQCVHILPKLLHRELITPVKKAYIDSTIRIESHIKY